MCDIAGIENDQKNCRKSNHFQLANFAPKHAE